LVVVDYLKELGGVDTKKKELVEIININGS
jgi:hypothetical protein